MSLFQSLVLGVVQGLTEFLPISSTAHLILAPWLFNWTADSDFQTVMVEFNILVQLGTTLAVIVYFAKDLWLMAMAILNGLRIGKPFQSENARLGWLIVVATFPAALIGLLFKNFFESLQHYPALVAAILLSAAGLLFLVERYGKRERGLDSLMWVDAVLIGCSQALALLPGVSRSAATLSGGLTRGLQREAAARFSFLMSIPILIAAGAVAFKDLLKIPNFTSYLPSLIVGVVAAALVGFASIHWLLGYLAKRSMNVFAWYRIAFGSLCLIVYFLR